MLALALGIITAFVAHLVFGTTSLVQGAAHPPSQSTAQQRCEYDMAVWFIVFGSFVWANTFFSCCCGSMAAAQHKQDEGADKKLAKCGPSNILGLFVFAWVCYGVHLRCAQRAGLVLHLLHEASR